MAELTLMLDDMNKNVRYLLTPISRLFSSSSEPWNSGLFVILSLSQRNRAGFVPRLLSAAALVAAGCGITILPMALRALHRESVVYRPLDRASAQRSTHEKQ